MVTKFLNIDTDSSLTANSNERVPSQKAIKTYTDAIDTAKQNKTLTTPITVGAIEETTVEGALGGINTSLSTKQDQTLSSSITVAGTPQTTVEGALSAINTVAGSAVQPSDLATVATTGSYNDLINQPIIPAAQVQSDWDESDESDVAYIKNKPHIPSEVIVDQTYNASSTNAQSGTAVAQAISTKQDILTAGDNITINNNVISAKDTTYIAGTGIAITEDSDKNLVISNTQTSAEWGNISGTLSNQTDLQNALNAKQDIITDLNTIRSGAEAGSTAVQPDDLAAVATTGNYTDLINKPTIPTKTSDLTNDSGFITGITSSDVTTALGYTPYNSTNPDGYTTNIGTVTSVNNTQPDSSGNVNINIPTPATVDQTYDSTSTNAQSGTAVAEAISTKQDTLVSGTNIKTVNGNSLLGSGNIDIEIPANIWTQDNLVAGDNVTFTKTINPNVLDPNTALACYHFNGNADNLIQNGVGLSSGFLQSINSYASESVYPWYSGYKSAILKRNSDWDGGIFSSLPSEFVSSDYTLDFRIRNVDSIYGVIRLFAGQNNSVYPKIDCMNGRQWIFYSSSSSSSTVSVTQNTWYHIAFVRHEGVTKIYFNGVEKASTSEQTSITNFLLHIGGGDEKQGIAELALVKEAKWTSNFTVPSEPYSLGIGSIYQVNATSQLPSQTGQSGKFLTTDGTDASWANVDALPSQTGQSGKFLTTDGSAASWADIPTEVDNQSVTLNSSDQIQAIGVIDQKTSSANKIWTGTKAEYDAIATKDPNTTYRTIDENETVYQNSYRIGQVLPSILPISDYGLHLLDGAVIDSTGIYSSFYSYIAGLVSTYPDLFISEADWQTAVTTYGVCGKFVYDSTNQTIRLPKITGIIEGTTDVTALGDLVQAGLPNITGGMSPTGLAGVSNSYGAFYDELNNTTDYQANTRGGYGVRWGFNAARSSSIYGNSNTVQPQTIKVYYYIVIANSYQTPTGVQISKVATDLNGKVNLNSSWGMPSTNRISLTISNPADTTYIAPDDGYFYAFVAPSTTSNYWIHLYNQTRDIGSAVYMGNIGYTILAFVPACKGDTVKLFLRLDGATQYYGCNFIYAQKDNN